MINIKQAFHTYCHDMALTYEKSKKYTTTEHRILTGLAVGAISIVSLGIGTRWAYGALVEKFTKKDGILESHEKVATETVNKINKQFQRVSDSFALKINDVNALKNINEEITHLHINIPELTDADLEGLGLKNIKFLNLAGCTKISDAALKKISECTNLETLILAGVDQITDKGFARLADLPKLTVLNIACCDGITDKGLKRLQDFKALSKLDLSGCPGITNDSIPNINLFADKLQALNIEGTNIKNFEFSQLKNLKNLQEVQLEASQVSKEPPECLKNVPVTAESLTFDASVTDEDLVHLKGYNQLEILDLSKCEKITNKGLEYLTGLQKLRVLSLSPHGKFDNDCIKILEKNKSLEEVKFVDSELEIEGHLSVVNSFEGVKAKEKSKLLALEQSRLESLSNAQKVKDAPKIIETPEKVELKEEKKELEPVNVPIVKKEEKIPQTRTIQLPKSLSSVNINASELKLNASTTDEDLKFLIYFKSLKNLDLSECTELTDNGLKYLEKLTKLESLSLKESENKEDSKKFSSQAIENSIRPLVNLVSLNLSLTKIVNLDCIKDFKKLNQLYLVACDNISDKTLVPIEKLEQLTYLRLSGCKNISNESLGIIFKLSNLRQLYLNSTGISNDEVYELGVLRNLERLNLSNTKISDDFLHQLSNLQKLKILALNGTNISNKGLELLKNQKSLTFLYLNQCIRITERGMRELKENKSIKVVELQDIAIKKPYSEITPLPHMEYEDVEKTRLKLNDLTVDEDLKLLKNFPEVKTLVFSNCEKIKNIDFKQLNEIKNLNSILIENYMDFSSEYFDGISEVEELRRLFIYDAEVSDRNLESLKDLKKLDVLVITSEGVSYTGLKILSEMASLKQLKLNGSQITYEGLVLLSKNKSLEKVLIEKCKLITEEQKSELKKLFKNITIK